MRIKHYKYSEIDFKKWDNAIESASNRLEYAKSWYLDIVSPQWEALISDDYEIVMPLPVKSKFGIKYLVQPVLTQQLGIFSKQVADKRMVNLFVEKIPYFSYELHLNEENKVSKATLRRNLLLDLLPGFSELELNFSKNTVRNLKLAKQNEITVTKNFGAKEFLDFYYETETKFQKPDKSICRQLIEKGVENQLINLYAAQNIEGQTIATFCLLKSGKRLINLLPISNDEGRETSAMFLLIENIIKEYSGSGKILDFEGSMIEGVARFYKGFGAQEVFYPLIKRFRPKFLIGKL